MTIETDIAGHLGDYAGLAALVGERIYPVRLPQTPTLPAVTYQRISGTTRYSHDGDSGLYSARWQFSCWAEHYMEAVAVGAQVKGAVHTWRNAHGQPAFVENEVDDYEPATGVYHVMVDATIWWRG